MMVKRIWLLLLCCPLVLAHQAVPPAYQIVHYGWSHYRQGNASLETGMPGAGQRPEPLSPRSQRELELSRQIPQPNNDRITALEDQQRQAQRPEVKVLSNKNPTAESRYKYTLALKNTLAKQVVRVSWDYAFYHPRQPQQETLRYQFVSEVKIKPGQTKTITAYTAAAPYGLVDAKSGDQMNERVFIKQIVYADGSSWEKP